MERKKGGVLGMRPTPAPNTTNVGSIERGLVAMGCAVDVIRGGGITIVIRAVLASIKRSHPERVGGQVSGG